MKSPGGMWIRKLQNASRCISKERQARRLHRKEGAERPLRVHHVALDDLELAREEEDLSWKIRCSKILFFSENDLALEGSFSSVPKPIFATTYSYFSIFQDLQDLHTFAPLRIQNTRKSSSNFFWIFDRISAKNHDFSTIFIEICSDFDDFFSGFRRIF